MDLENLAKIWIRPIVSWHDAAAQIIRDDPAWLCRDILLQHMVTETKSITQEQEKLIFLLRPSGSLMPELW